MGTGQTMLTIMALVLLGTTVLSVNRNNLNQGTILRQTELGIYAVSLATSFVQHATSLAFDELVVVRPVLPLNPVPSAYLSSDINLKRDYTHLHALQPGQEANEIENRPSTFDDIDDYNNFVVDTLIQNVDRFHVTAFVKYVSTTQPYSKINVPSWLKRIDFFVTSSISRKVFEDTRITNKEGSDTIKVSYIRSYY